MPEDLFLVFVLILILIVAAISVTAIIKFMDWFHELIDYLERRY